MPGSYHSVAQVFRERFESGSPYLLWGEMGSVAAYDPSDLFASFFRAAVYCFENGFHFFDQRFSRQAVKDAYPG